jgi:quinol monooxygenase YgiN
MAEVVVVATLKAKPGREDEVEAALAGIAVPSHEEPGCIRYALHRGVDDPTRIVLVERWASRQDLDEHFTHPYTQNLPDPSEYLDEPPQIFFLEPRPTGDETKGTL